MKSKKSQNTVDNISQALRQPYQSSQKIYIEEDDIRVPMRKIKQQDTQSEAGMVKNPDIVLYDTSGEYTQDNFQNDLNAGLPKTRLDWIQKRGDCEQLFMFNSEHTNELTFEDLPQRAYP
ncbi:phosphomethylpyrimidine synthase ThiC, partial [Francisellaceae bacterium]|nr:phosphomethylpyrimidine synthase ThiC [Francisellaceae bacterium]